MVKNINHTLPINLTVLPVFLSEFSLVQGEKLQVQFPGVRLQQLHCARHYELGIILNNLNPLFTWAF